MTKGSNAAAPILTTMCWVCWYRSQLMVATSFAARNCSRAAVADFCGIAGYSGGSTRGGLYGSPFLAKKTAGSCKIPR